MSTFCKRCGTRLNGETPCPRCGNPQVPAAQKAVAPSSEPANPSPAAIRSAPRAGVAIALVGAALLACGAAGLFRKKALPPAPVPVATPSFQPIDPSNMPHVPCAPQMPAVGPLPFPAFPILAPSSSPEADASREYHETRIREIEDEMHERETRRLLRTVPNYG